MQSLSQEWAMAVPGEVQRCPSVKNKGANFQPQSEVWHAVAASAPETYLSLICAGPCCSVRYNDGAMANGGLSSSLIPVILIRKWILTKASIDLSDPDYLIDSRNLFLVYCPKEGCLHSVSLQSPKFQTKCLGHWLQTKSQSKYNMPGPQKYCLRPGQ